MMRFLGTIVVLLALAGIALAAVVYTGAYDVAADAPHSPLVYRLLQTARQRSIAARAGAIAVPPLDEPSMIAEGGEHYAAMCAGCHLAPGAADTEIRRGLYPRPPKLAEAGPLPPAQAFWAVKHGIKLTAMPAWGATHSDAEIWNIVAFVRKLPGMTPEQYRSLTGAGEPGQGHEHHHGEAGDHDHDAGAEHEHAHDAGHG